MDGKPGCDSREGKGDGWRESHDVMQGLEQGCGMEEGEGGGAVGASCTGYNANTSAGVYVVLR